MVERFGVAGSLTCLVGGAGRRKAPGGGRRRRPLLYLNWQRNSGTELVRPRLGGVPPRPGVEPISLRPSRVLSSGGQAPARAFRVSCGGCLRGSRGLAPLGQIGVVRRRRPLGATGLDVARVGPERCAPSRPSRGPAPSSAPPLVLGRRQWRSAAAGPAPVRSLAGTAEPCRFLGNIRT